MARSGRHGLVGGSPARQSELPEKRRQGACVRREGSRCEKTEAAIKKPIAAPAWTLSGTRLPLRNLCVLPAVRAAVGGFLRRRGALCAGRCTLGRLFRLTDAARPRTWRYVITHCMRDKVHVTNSWQSSRTCPMCIIVALCMGWNFDAVSMRDKTQDGRHMHRRNILACHTALLNHIRVLRVAAVSRVLEESTYSGMPSTQKPEL